MIIEDCNGFSLDFACSNSKFDIPNVVLQIIS